MKLKDLPNFPKKVPMHCAVEDCLLCSGRKERNLALSEVGELEYTMPSIIYQAYNKTNPDGYLFLTKEKAEKFLQDNKLDTGSSGWNIVKRRICNP